MALRSRYAVALRTVAEKRVFVVEDDDDSRSLIAAWLQEGHRHVIEAATPDLDFDGDLHQQDVFLIDLCLREGDGLTLIERLAERQFDGAIVLMSAFPEKVIHNVRELAISRGLCAPNVLQKPFTHDQLMTSIHAAADCGRGTVTPPGDEPTERLGDLMDERRLFFHYQPIVCALTGALHGVESLARAPPG
jgi:CheY-like chemotaxis protein